MLIIEYFIRWQDYSHNQKQTRKADCTFPTGGASKLTFSPSLTLEEVEKENPQVAEGRYHPAECSALQRVAILIPHRNRERHLLYLLEHLHPFLQRQQLEYGIYVIHQVGQLCRGWGGCLLSAILRAVCCHLCHLAPVLSLLDVLLLVEGHSGSLQPLVVALQNLSRC